MLYMARLADSHPTVRLHRLLVVAAVQLLRGQYRRVGSIFEPGAKPAGSCTRRLIHATRQKVRAGMHIAAMCSVACQIAFNTLMTQHTPNLGELGSKRSSAVGTEPDGSPIPRCPPTAGPKVRRVTSTHTSFSSAPGASWTSGSRRARVPMPAPGPRKSPREIAHALHRAADASEITRPMQGRTLA